MNETYALSMGFKTDLGKVYTLRLTGADPDVTETRIRNAMLAVIDSEVIAHKNGTPAEILSAELIKTESVVIDVK